MRFATRSQSGSAAPQTKRKALTNGCQSATVSTQNWACEFMGIPSPVRGVPLAGGIGPERGMLERGFRSGGGRELAVDQLERAPGARLDRHGVLGGVSHVGSQDRDVA